MELLRVAVGGADQHDGLVALGQGGAVDVDVGEGDTGRELHGRVVAQDLLDRRANEGRIGA